MIHIVHPMEPTTLDLNAEQAHTADRFIAVECTLHERAICVMYARACYLPISIRSVTLLERLIQNGSDLICLADEETESSFAKGTPARAPGRWSLTCYHCHGSRSLNSTFRHRRLPTRLNTHVELSTGMRLPGRAIIRECARYSLGEQCQSHETYLRRSS